jgi:hypothetical protein
MEIREKFFIYNTDGEKWWSRTHISYPILDIINKDVWRIYYSTRDGNNHSRIGYIDVESEKPDNILYIHNEPLLELGNPEPFDESGTLPACIIQHNTRKYLYYMGVAVPKEVAYFGSIGVAEIIDNNNIPILLKLSTIKIPTPSPFGYGICEVMCDHNSLLRMYNTVFTGWLSHNDPVYEIHCHQSTDGFNWGQGKKCNLNINDEFEWAAPRVFVKGNGYGMIFVARGKNDFRDNIEKTYRIGYAESKDGIDFIIQKQEIGIRNFQNSQFDSQMQCYPSVKQYGNKLWVFYSGNNFGMEGIGYAELEI